MVRLVPPVVHSLSLPVRPAQTHPLRATTPRWPRCRATSSSICWLHHLTTTFRRIRTCTWMRLSTACQRCTRCTMSTAAYAGSSRTLQVRRAALSAHSHSSQRAAASRARDAPRRDDRRLRGGYLCPGAVAARRAGHAGGLQGKSETAQLFTQRFSPYALQSRLQLAMHRAHDESEELADAYVEGLPLSHTVPLDVCYGSAVH